MDISKDFEVTMLYDLYRSLLTEKQRDILDMYYNLNYTLSEIAQNEGISRQAALDAINRGREKLYDTEDRVRLYAKYRKTMDVLNALVKEAKGMPGEIRKKIEDYVESAKQVWEDN